MRNPFALVLLIGVANLHALPPIKLEGSTTVQAALEPKRAELEALTGRKIEFTPSGSSMGLASLAADGAQIAMISSSLGEITEKINAKKPGTIDAAKFHSVEIGRVKIAFIVNPRNRIRALTAAQLADIFTAKITNWKDLGGSDGAIVVVSLANGGPLIPDHLLHGKPITSTARFVANATQIPSVVAQQVNAIGIISTAHVKGPTSLVQTDAEISVPLFLVTKGDPKPDEQTVIDAARKLLGAGN